MSRRSPSSIIGALQQGHALMVLSLTLLICALVASAPFASAAVSGTNGIFDPHRQWQLTQRLRDDGLGQNFFNYSDHFDIDGRFIAIGATMANGHRGLCRILYDAGDGSKLVATLKDDAGSIGDGFGKFVRLFFRFGAEHVAVAAPEKGRDGSVFVYRNIDHDPSNWQLQEQLTVPAGTLATEFGRSIHWDGVQLVISSVARYIASDRFAISAVNQKGTRFFLESNGIEPMATGDPLFVFRTLDGRRNSTRLSHVQTIADGPYTTDFGRSIDIDKDSGTMLVGASIRQESQFGYGADGDLIVSDVKLLDGSAEYNFNNVEILAGGTLTTDLYDGVRRKGGFLNLKVQGHFIVRPGGKVNMSAHGLIGAPTKFSSSIHIDGEGTGGGETARSIYTGVDSCQYDGGAATIANIPNALISKTVNNRSSTIPFAEANGGGGGYGTMGEDGVKVQCGQSGKGGRTYGDEMINQQIGRLGSGGGAGFPWKIGSGGKGGEGGGAIRIVARDIQNYGQILADGGDGENGGFFSGGGGGGSGGSIFLQGITFANHGHIYSRGGRGGIRAQTSGSDGDVTVRGGNGGVGRIRFEFLTIQNHGHVVPNPRNTTEYLGDIYWYEKDALTHTWALRSVLPRLPSMKFTGHSVAVLGHHAAIASDERVAVSPEQSVFLIDFKLVKNSSSPIFTWRQIMPPERKIDRGFGYRLAWSNQSLLIGSWGEENVGRGVVYQFISEDLFQTTKLYHTFLSGINVAGNEFGREFAFQYPQLLLMNPLNQDDGIAASVRRSVGNIHLLKHVYNVSATDSFITCDFVKVTGNTTLNCTLNARDNRGQKAGDIHDHPWFSYPRTVSGFTYVSRGVYTFYQYLPNVGDFEVSASYKGTKVQSLMIHVTPAITHHITNFTCEPEGVVAGQEVTCTIYTPGGTGEQNAQFDFNAIIYNTDDVSLIAEAPVKGTPLGRFKGPRSRFIPGDPLLYDFPTLNPPVTQVRFGVYQFTFRTWRPGPFAAFVQYQNLPIEFPNPHIIQAAHPSVNYGVSLLECPAIAAPGRTLACTLFLRGDGHVHTGLEALAVNYTSHHQVQALLNDRPQIVSSVWSGEGRYSILVHPNATGVLKFSAQYDGRPVQVEPAAGVNIERQYVMTCPKISAITQSCVIMTQHAKGRGDEYVYQGVATKAFYVEGSVMCDAPLV